MTPTPKPSSDYAYTTPDPGHSYELPALDGEHSQELRFVKRCDPAHPERFPGNTNRYPGTTLQVVIRVLLNRLAYLQWQVWSVENAIIMRLLRASLWLLEFRAARRHGHGYWHGLRFASEARMCGQCGHTQCDHQKEGAVKP